MATVFFSTERFFSVIFNVIISKTCQIIDEILIRDFAITYYLYLIRGSSKKISDFPLVSLRIKRYLKYNHNIRLIYANKVSIFGIIVEFL